MTSYRLHRIFWTGFAIPAGSAFLGLRFRIQIPRRSELKQLPDHFLLISNHVTNYDPVILGKAFRRHMYYVASEHIINKGIFGKLLSFFMAPITRPKGAGGAGAVMEILRRLKEKKSVVLFAEGNTSWDGRAIPVPEATGKMVRASGAPLVTCRIKGGYFSRPRWAYTNRRGPLSVELVHIYRPEELKGMKPGDINALINRDIGEDAYATLRSAPALYKGKDLARGIEHALVLCPACHKIDSLRSSGNTFSCTACGLTGSFSEDGSLTVEGMEAKDIPTYFTAQQEYFRQLPDPEQETEYTEDGDLLLNRIEGKCRTLVHRGRVVMTNQALKVGSLTFLLKDITSLAVRVHGVVSFSLTDGSYYELVSPSKANYNGLKYKLLFERFALK